MIFSCFFKALGQLDDPKFLRVVFLGIALSLATLLGVYALFLGAMDFFIPEKISIPFVGEVGGIDTLLSWGSFFFMIVLSIFLMVPVAVLFVGFFLEDICTAVEARHYSTAPPARKVPLSDSIIDSINFLGVLIAVNTVALLLYAFSGPFAPLVFWAVNGYLLGREYFQLVALRRHSRNEAKSLRKKNFGTIWFAGILMAAPLSIPLLNLIIPVIGVATFTHLYHRLAANDSSNQNLGFQSHPTE